MRDEQETEKEREGASVHEGFHVTVSYVSDGSSRSAVVERLPDSGDARLHARREQREREREDAIDTQLFTHRLLQL